MATSTEPLNGGHFNHENTTAPKADGVLSLFNNKGKTAIVSGAGAGIGLVVAHALAESGANVAVRILRLRSRAIWTDRRRRSGTIRTRKPSIAPRRSRRSTTCSVRPTVALLLRHDADETVPQAAPTRST